MVAASKWLTPNNSPLTTRAILLIVPDDDEFEAIIRGALAELVFSDHYEKHGALTPEETAAIMLPAILATLDWIEP